MRTSLRTGLRVTDNPCDEWWESLTQGEKGAVWFLLRMVENLKVGGSIEVRRGPENIEAHAIDPDELEKIRSN